MSKLLLAAMIAVLASQVVLGCSPASSPVEEGPPDNPEDEGFSKNPPSSAPTAGATDQATEPKVIEGEIGEALDLGPSTIEIKEVYKTRPNPPKGYDNEHYDGTFLLIVFDYTNNTKQPVEISGTDAPWWVEDSEGRQFAPDEQGFGSTVALTADLDYMEMGATANPGLPLHMWESFQVPDEEGLRFTLRGGDLLCPQCGAFFAVKLPEELPHPTPPPGSPATAAASAGPNAGPFGDNTATAPATGATATATGTATAE